MESYYILRKGKKVLKAYKRGDTAFQIAEDIDTLKQIFPASRISAVQRFLERNAFTLAIYGSKARLGDGVILEMHSDVQTPYGTFCVN